MIKCFTKILDPPTSPGPRYFVPLPPPILPALSLKNKKSTQSEIGKFNVLRSVATCFSVSPFSMIILKLIYFDVFESPSLPIWTYVMNMPLRGFNNTEIGKFRSENRI